MSEGNPVHISQWSQSDDAKDEVSRLRQQNADLKDRLSQLIEASRRISGSLDSDTILEQVIESARSLTGARYGVLLTYDDSGGVQDVFTSGITPEERLSLEQPPRGWGLLGYLNEIDEPLRLADIASHPRSIGFPKNHPPMKTFLGMPIRRGEEHVGNIFLTEKHGGEEFTSEDEETLVMFVSQAATAMRNARTYEQELSARADLQTLLDISPVAVSVFDAKTGRMLSCNSEFRRQAGDMLETPWEDSLPQWKFMRSDGREIPLAELPLSRVFQFGETVRAEDIVVELPDGRVIPTLINAAPMYSEQGRLVAAMVAIQDLTPLADLERVRAEFLGLVSEELRMPLSAIKGSVSALSSIEGPGPSGQAESQQLLRIIDQQADLMRMQVNSLVELTYIQTGTLSISPEAADVSDLLDDATREFMRGHAGGNIQTEAAPELPRAMADKQRIGQVLNNLLYIAASHTNDLSSIMASAYLIDIYIAISVSVDTGITPEGESTGLLQRMLGPQVHEIRRPIEGENLALAMCKGIVEAHGGRIRVENEDEPRGMTITFTIPVVEDPAAAEPGTDTVQPEETETIGVAPAGGTRILVSMDDPRVLAAMRRTLSRAGYKPLTAYDRSAMERYMGDDKPHLVLLDLSSSAAGGFQLTQRLSRDYDVPVIVLSGQGDDENIERAFEVGADDYIVKPFSPTELVARIKASLRKRIGAGQPLSSTLYVSGNITIDYDGRAVTVSGAPVHLTATEYELLVELSRRSGRVLTQEELLQRVWGPGYSGESQLLRSYVKSLRQKLGDNARAPTHIFTEHGVGYRMQKA